MQNYKVSGLTGDMAVLEMGSEYGSPLVAVHGWLDNAASFIHLGSELPGFRWIALDLPGHGHSDYRPPGSVYHFTDYIGDLHRATWDLGLDRFILVGHSLGAGISAAFTAAFPGRVEKLVLIDGIGPISGRDDDSLGQLRKSMAHFEEPEQSAARVYPSWEFLVRRRLEAGDIARHSVETLLSRGAVEQEDGVRVLSDGRLKQHSPIYMSQAKVLSILGGISCPALLVLAEQGLVHSRKSTGERIRAVESLKVARVPGAHHVHLDDPGIVAAELVKFLGQEA